MSIAFINNKPQLLIGKEYVGLVFVNDARTKIGSSVFDFGVGKEEEPPIMMLKEEPPQK